MAGLGIALRGLGLLAKGAGKVLKRKPKQKSLKLKTDTKTKLKSALKNKPKGPAGKKYKSRMDYIKKSNERAGNIGVLGTAGMVVGGGEALKRKKKKTNTPHGMRMSTPKNKNLYRSKKEFLAKKKSK